MLPSGIDMAAPARDVIHFRLHTPRHPLIGESPIAAAALALGVNVALAGNQAAFFSNMSRPSGILTVETPEGRILTRAEIDTLRESFDQQARGMNAGRLPILQKMSFVPLTITSQDAQLIEAQRMSIEDVARCFGVPRPIVGDLSNATMSNVESMINFWLATGLGSLFENLERSFDSAFALPADEYIEFDESALLRMDYVKRVEALTKAIQGGVLSPNEARQGEGLPPVDGGGTVFLQKQMVSIDLLAQLHAAEITRAATPPPAPLPEPEDDEPEEDDGDEGEGQEEEDDKEADPVIAKALFIELRDRKRKAAKANAPGGASALLLATPGLTQPRRVAP
jgi:phage portal protein BeeE